MLGVLPFVEDPNLSVSAARATSATLMMAKTIAMVFMLASYNHQMSDKSRIIPVCLVFALAQDNHLFLQEIKTPPPSWLRKLRF